MDAITSLDTAFFYLINRDGANAVFDVFFPWVTKLDHFVIPLALLVVWLAVRGGRRGRLCLLAIGLTVAITDPVTVRLVKPAVDRDRPCVALEDARLVGSRRTSPSFPSAHAVNSAAVATLFAVFYRRSVWISVPVVVLVGVSRVYTGVHYPLDVVAGWLFGGAIALLVAALLWRLGRTVRWLRWPPTALERAP